jgi:MoxR-like ATPase
MTLVSNPTVTLAEAQRLLTALGPHESVVLLSPPGVGKTEMVQQAAAAAGLPCRSLLGTQIAPEDVNGVPRIQGERTVFCPPRVLLPENPQPFCLFLDELPAASADVQKALYSLLLERRVGEHQLPRGSWVVAAGNRLEDRALSRPLSAALVNRVFMISVRADVGDWLRWAGANAIRADVRAFIRYRPEALSRAVPDEAGPYSTPRAWASLSRALTLAEGHAGISPILRRSLAFGRVSAEDAAIFCAVSDDGAALEPRVESYVRGPHLLPEEGAGRWLVLSAIRNRVRDRKLEIAPRALNRFLEALLPDHRAALLVDLAPQWAELGARPALLSDVQEAAA